MKNKGRIISFGEYATEHYPHIRRGSAIRKLRQNIQNNSLLVKELEQTGFFNAPNSLTPLQQRILKSHLGL